MNKEELFYEPESKTARPHNYSIRYKHKEDIIYPSMVIRSQAETIELQNKKISQLTNNWNELEEWLKQQSLISLRYEIGYYKEVLDKMKEISGR